MSEVWTIERHLEAGSEQGRRSSTASSRSSRRAASTRRRSRRRRSRSRPRRGFPSPGRGRTVTGCSATSTSRTASTIRAFGARRRTRRISSCTTSAWSRWSSSTISSPAGSRTRTTRSGAEKDEARHLRRRPRGHLDGEEIVRFDVPTLREWFERGGADETGERVLLAGHAAASADRAEEVLPHGRQLPRARGRLEGCRLVARDRAGSSSSRTSTRSWARTSRSSIPSTLTVRGA